jgi:hypothetical protein
LAGTGVLASGAVEPADAPPGPSETGAPPSLAPADSWAGDVARGGALGSRVGRVVSRVGVGGIRTVVDGDWSKLTSSGFGGSDAQASRVTAMNIKTAANVPVCLAPDINSHLQRCSLAREV